jgi:hypothetical protein
MGITKLHRHSFVIALSMFCTVCLGQDDVLRAVKENQYDLAENGKTFLLKESKDASFFLLGELHGEQEIPNLLYSLWPHMGEFGYNYIAAEVSPWSASKLEFAQGIDTLRKEGLWTNREAKTLHRPGASPNRPTIWGCDMEEVSLGLLLQELAEANAKDAVLRHSVDMVRNGYNRKMAPELLASLKGYSPKNDVRNNGASLFENIVSSLRIDSARAFPQVRLTAQIRRETLMKHYFLHYYDAVSGRGTPKVLFRFGRNHLHRGFDDRGISTLGNFVSEYAIAKGLKSFNVAAFAAGGQYSLGDQVFDADETGDDLAFKFLSDNTDHGATVFDLRPLRFILRQIKDRTPLHNRLLYWSNSYDAIICFQKVTPIVRH